MIAMRILKWTVELDGQEVTLDGDLRPLHVDDQHGFVMLWCEHNYEMNWQTKLVFHVLKTGEDRQMPETAVFLGTVLMNDGSYVMHIYVTKTIEPRNHAKAREQVS